MTGHYKQVLPAVAAHLKAAALAAFQATATECANRIIDRCPVDTGRARYHNQLGINTGEFDITDAVDPSGSTAKSNAAAQAQGLTLGDVAVIGNPLPYAELLEMGSSQQAPTGFYGITAVEVPGIWEREFKGAIE